MLLLLLLISRIPLCPFSIICDIVFRFSFASYLSFTGQWFLFFKLWESNPYHLFRFAQKRCKRAYRCVFNTKISRWINFLKKKWYYHLYAHWGQPQMRPHAFLQHELTSKHSAFQDQQCCWGNMDHVLRSTGFSSIIPENSYSHGASWDYILNELFLQQQPAVKCNHFVDHFKDHRPTRDCTFQTFLWEFSIIFLFFCKTISIPD